MGLLYKKTTGRRPTTPPKSHIANVLGGHRLDEQSGGRLLSQMLNKAENLRVRQRSGEGVVRRNGCPKGCLGESVSSLKA